MPLQGGEAGQASDLAAQLIEIVKPLTAALAADGLTWLAARRKNDAEAQAIVTSAKASAIKMEAEAHAIDSDAVVKATAHLADLWERQNKGLRDELAALRQAMRERDQMDRERDQREREWSKREASLRRDLAAARDESARACVEVAELRALLEANAQIVTDFIQPQTKPVGFAREAEPPV